MSKAVRRQAECADCRTVKEIRAHGFCATCYSRRCNAGYRFDGPAPAVASRTRGFTGPCARCGEAKPPYRRQFCDNCYQQWRAQASRQERWRQLNEIRGRR